MEQESIKISISIHKKHESSKEKQPQYLKNIHFWTLEE